MTRQIVSPSSIPAMVRDAFESLWRSDLARSISSCPKMLPQEWPKISTRSPFIACPGLSHPAGALDFAAEMIAAP